MVDFGDLIRLQKRMPPECPIRLTPFINDPLAFIGEKDLDRKAVELKSAVSSSCAGDPALADVLKKIDENRGDMSQAEFIEFLIESHFAPEAKSDNRAMQAEMDALRGELKDLMQREKKMATSSGESPLTPTAQPTMAAALSARLSESQ